MNKRPPLIDLHRLLAAGRAAGHPVAHDGRRVVVWGEFAGQVATLARRLEARSASRWLLSGDDALPFAIGFFALLHAGKTVVIAPNTQAGTLAELADAFDARLDPAPLELSAAPVALPAIDPARASIDLYTSGSTGVPKRVRKSLAQFAAEVAVLEALWGEVIGARAILATAPHQHIYGLLFRLLWPLASGRLFDAVTCAHPDTLEERLARLGPSVLVSTPAQLARWPDLLALGRLVGRVGTIFSSGGPLPAATAARFLEDYGQAPIEVFGSTESGGVAWRRQAQGDAAWTPFPGLTVARSAAGALRLRSPFLPGDAALEMDDAIELLPDGRFGLRGRLDRVVKIEEKRLSLPAMEQRLDAHRWVAHSALVALAGRRQSVGAVIVLSDEGRQQSAARRDIVRSLRQHLAAYFDAVVLPRHWRFVDALPVSERGKLAHAALDALFAPAAAGAPPSPPAHLPTPLATSLPTLLPTLLDVRSEEGSVLLTFRVEASLVHFAGHFPGRPILPGVVQLDWALRYARAHLPLEGEFAALENVKFQSLVLPDATLELSLGWDAGRRRLDFSYRSSERKCSQGRVVFAGAV